MTAPEVQPSHPWRVRLRWFCAALCWVVAGGILLAEGLRLLGIDTWRSSLIAMSTAWPLVVLPGILVVPGAAYLRRRSLTAATVVVVLIVLSAWWPCWIGQTGPGPKGAARLRVLALNVEYTQDTGAAASRQIRAQNPDIVVLSELSPRNQRHLDLTRYRYSSQHPKTNAFGQGIWSRWPITEESTWSVNGLDMLRLTVHTPTGPVRIYQVHTDAPQNAQGRRIWKQQLKQLHEYLNAERRPVIAAGDFNGSHWDGPYSDLLGGPRRIADAGQGRGYLATWPSGRRLPPLLPLDHVLVSRGVGVRHFKVLGPVGSDHRGVLADLTLS